MFSLTTTTESTSRKDAKSFAPSCSYAHKNSDIAIISGIALAMSVFLSIIRLNIYVIIFALSALIIKASALKRKKQFVVEL